MLYDILTMIFKMSQKHYVRKLAKYILKYGKSAQFLQKSLWAQINQDSKKFIMGISQTFNYYQESIVSRKKSKQRNFRKLFNQHFI